MDYLEIIILIFIFLFVLSTMLLSILYKGPTGDPGDPGPIGFSGISEATFNSYYELVEIDFSKDSSPFTLSSVTNKLLIFTESNQIGTVILGPKWVFGSQLSIYTGNIKSSVILQSGCPTNCNNSTYYYYVQQNQKKVPFIITLQPNNFYVFINTGTSEIIEGFIYSAE